LMGATGTGKTYTMSQVIAQVNKPTLVIAHNKTLAAQLCSEFKSFFPNNAVELKNSLCKDFSVSGGGSATAGRCKP